LRPRDSKLLNYGSSKKLKGEASNKRLGRVNAS
jgi:hypothetical protein